MTTNTEIKASILRPQHPIVVYINAWMKQQELQVHSCITVMGLNFHYELWSHQSTLDCKDLALGVVANCA